MLSGPALLLTCDCSYLVVGESSGQTDSRLPFAPSIYEVARERKRDRRLDG